MDTQDSCYSTVPETTVGGILSTEESGDITPMNGFDCCNSNSENLVEGENDTGSACVQNIDTISIDCLSIENIKEEQDKQTEIQLIKQWKVDNSRPDWSEVAQYGPELKAYWSAWNSLYLDNGIVPKEIRCGVPRK